MPKNSIQKNDYHWICPQCDNENSFEHLICWKCKTPPPTETATEIKKFFARRNSFSFKKLIFFLLLPMILLSGVVKGCFHVVEYASTTKVKKVIPPWFPVLIIFEKEKDNYDCKIIPHGKIPVYKKSIHNLSFTIPRGKYTDIENLVKKYYPRGNEKYCLEWENPYPWYATYKVTQLSKKKQLFEIECYWSDDSPWKSSYTAIGDKIYPKTSMTYFGPGAAIAFFAFALSALFIGGTLFLLFLIYRQIIGPLNNSKFGKTALLFSLLSCMLFGVFIIFFAGKATSQAALILMLLSTFSPLIAIAISVISLFKDKDITPAISALIISFILWSIIMGLPALLKYS